MYIRFLNLENKNLKYPLKLFMQSELFGLTNSVKYLMSFENTFVYIFLYD